MQGCASGNPWLRRCTKKRLMMLRWTQMVHLKMQLKEQKVKLGPLRTGLKICSKLQAQLASKDAALANIWTRKQNKYLIYNLQYPPDLQVSKMEFREPSEHEYGLAKCREEQSPGIDDCCLFPGTLVQSASSNERFMAAYQMTELSRFGAGSGVSLTLGLQHYDGISILPMSRGNNHNFAAMRGDDVYNAAASSIGADRVRMHGFGDGAAQV